jgi:hypothetical protein
MTLVVVRLDWFLRWWNGFTVSERMSGDEVGYDQASRIVETRAVARGR